MEGDAGYEFVHIDDCWMNWERDEHGKLSANQSRFPSGIGALSDYVSGSNLNYGEKKSKTLLKRIF